MQEKIVILVEKHFIGNFFYSMFHCWIEGKIKKNLNFENIWIRSGPVHTEHVI